MLQGFWRYYHIEKNASIAYTFYMLFQKRLALFLCMFFVLCAKNFARGKTDSLETLIRSGSSEEIKTAIKKNPDVITYTIGKTKDNLLMKAIEYGREKEIIDVLLKGGISPAKKNKLGQTAVSYACAYSPDADYLENILTKRTSSRARIRNYLMKKDKTGMYAAAYAENNDGENVRLTVRNRLENKDIQTLEKHTEGGIPKLANADGLRQTRARVTMIGKNKKSKSVPQNQTVSDKTEKPAPEPENQNDQNYETEESSSKVQSGETEKPDIETEPQTVPDKNNKPEESEEPAKPEENIKLEKTETAVDTVSPEIQMLSPVVSEKESKPEKSEIIIEEKNKTATAIESPKRASEKKYLYDYAEDESERENETPAISLIDEIDKKGVTSLMHAIKTANDWSCRKLLENGANVNAKDSEGWTPLMYAVRYQNNTQLVKLLLDHGANVDIKNNYNISAVTIAAKYSENPEIVSLLFSKSGRSENEMLGALVYAIIGFSQNEEIRLAKLNLFLNAGVRVNRFYRGKTPLMYAAEYSPSEKVIDALLEHGANPAAKNADGLTSFDFAKKNKMLSDNALLLRLNE